VKPVAVELQDLVVDGTPATYRVAGSGEPLVLVHGLSGSWRWWQPVLEPLAARRRVHLVDLPRLGRRFPAAELTGWLGRWLDAAALERVDLIGHSLGGLIAAELAAAQPRRVQRLVLIAPAGIPCGRTVLSRSVRLLETLKDVRRHLPTVAGDALRAGPVSLLRGAVFASHRHLTEELASVDARTLLMWGDHDRLLPARIAAEWHRILPGSRLVRLPGGHVPMWEAPRELVSSLLAFLDDQLVNDPCDELGSGVVDSMRLTVDDDKPTAR
jgi:pimeloyl-ACP methyl ester carboxylesterase